MLGRELKVTLNLSFREARKQRHELLSVEHLLLALLGNTSVVKVLNACDADIEKLQTALEEFIDKTTPRISPGIENQDTEPTIGFQRVLQRAVFHVQSSNRDEVDGANVLVAMYSEQESQAVYLLKQQGIERIDLVNYIAHGVTRKSETGEAREDLLETGADGEAAEATPLDLYTTNLNEAAKNGAIDPLVGRVNEVERIIQTLSRRRKNNPLLVGEAGVGKTAIAEGLARMIVEGKVPEVIKDSTVYALDLGALLAGTKYRGDFERRLKGLLNQLKSEPGAGVVY